MRGELRSRPRRRTRCARNSARSEPAIRLNRVVLPAPFGPMTPVTPPRGSCKRHAVDGDEAAEALADILEAEQRRAHARRLRHLPSALTTAPCKPSRARPTARISRTPNNARSTPGMRPAIVAREFAKEMQRQRADQRPEHRAEAADDRPHQRLDRDPGAEADRGVDEQEILRIERAGERGEGGGNDDRLQLDRERIDAERLRGGLVLAHRDQIGAEAAALEDRASATSRPPRSRARSKDRAGGSGTGNWRAKARA